MIRPIVLWPDPILSRTCDKIVGVDDAIRALAADMLDTMYDAPGRGLAAPQVGVPLRLFVMDCTWKDGEKSPRALINPEIVTVSNERVFGPESCLSIPGITARVERHQSITMRWTGLDGQPCEDILTGFEAVCAQHEIDHLNGIVIFDRVPPDTRAVLEAGYAA